MPQERLSQDYNFILDLARKIKSIYDIPIVFGGYHISSLPHTLPNFIDIGVIGEGEETFKELLDKYFEYGRFHHDWLKDVKSIVYHHNGKININEYRLFIENLDTIPPPARDIFDKEHWKPRLSGFSYREGLRVFGRISTSRGCPFKCIFCNSSKFWGNKIRYFSAKYVVSEISLLMTRCGCNSIHGNDDLFTVNIARLEEIVKLLKIEGLLKKVEFASIQARVDTFSDDVCRLLKELGVRSIGFGIESGSNKILKYLKKDSVNIEQNWEAVKRALKWGFFVWPQLIVGCPGETKEDILKTLEFTRIKEIPHYQITMLIPYPGTELWYYAKGRSLVDDNMDFSRLALDIKKWELRNRIYLGDRLMCKKVWQLIKDPFEREEQLSLSNAKLDLKRNSWRYFKIFLNKPIESSFWAITRIKSKLRRVLGVGNFDNNTHS